MRNVTTEISLPVNVFHRYLLGESLKNSLIRLTVILSAIILVWAAMILILIIRLTCQRARQLAKPSTTHHLYENEDNPLRKQSDQLYRNRRFDSSTSSLSSTRCYSLRLLFSQLKRCCIFRPSSTTVQDNPKKRSSVASKQRVALGLNSYTLPARIQIVVENTSQRSSSMTPSLANIGKKLSLYHETDSSSADELKNLCPTEVDHELQTEINRKPSSVSQLTDPKQYLHQPSLSPSLSDANVPTSERLQKLHEFNTKATLLFHPITRRLSNTNTNSCLPPINIMQKHKERKSLLVVSSARELTTNNKWKWKHSLVNDPVVRDERVTSSARQLPLVMITDTSSSNTNIVELETYEDNHRLMTDLEKRLARQLRSSYRPRHST